MKKVLLKEGQLIKIIKRIINEQNNLNSEEKKLIELKNILENKNIFTESFKDMDKKPYLKIFLKSDQYTESFSFHINDKNNYEIVSWSYVDDHGDKEKECKDIREILRYIENFHFITITENKERLKPKNKEFETPYQRFKKYGR